MTPIALAFSGVHLKIESGEGTSSSSPIKLTLWPYSDGAHGNQLIIKSPPENDPLINQSTLFELKNAQNYSNNAMLEIRDKCNCIIQERAKLLLGTYSQIIVNEGMNTQNPGYMNWDYGSIVEMKEYSQVVIKPTGIVTNYGANFSNALGSEIKVESGGIYEIYNNQIQTFTAGGKLNLEGGTLKLDDNAQLIFDGSDANFYLSSNSTVLLGTNAKIYLKNGAAINTTGSNITFEGNQHAIWQGIEFINASSKSIIDNCTFRDVILPIKIDNNQSSAFAEKLITNNNFYLASYGTYGIYAKNIFFLNLENNDFYLTPTSNGVRINNYYDLISPVGDEIKYNLNIKDNDFYNGYVDLLLANYTSSVVPYEIIGNTFCSNTYIPILGRMISGNIKNNEGLNNTSQRAFHFTQSNVYLYGNTNFQANNGMYAGDAAINLSPVISQQGLIGYGGRNKINATMYDVLSFNNSSVSLDNGENYFYKSVTSAYHLFGMLNVNGSTSLSAKNNCFNLSWTPSYVLWNEMNDPVDLQWAGSTFSCDNSTSSGVGWIVRDIGYGCYDSVIITPLPSGSQLSDEDLLYSQAIYYYNEGNYFNAVTDYKSFINQYPASNNIYSSLYDLYTCYEQLDTVPSQSHRNIHYGNLLTYLNEKINSGLYDDNFNSIAYSLTLCCYANITDYNSALDGYEFISLYHPNPDIRILASWDYAEVQALLNSGAGLTNKNEKMTEAQFLKERIGKMEKLIKEDPVKNKVKKSYLKLTKEKEKTMEVALNKFTKTEIKNKMQNIKKEEANLKNKAVSNLKNIVTYTNEERENKQLEDIILISGLKNIEDRKSIIDDNKIPENYELSQNYPNPFNPVTSIKYSIPKDGLVAITIYDITGKEMRKLVNEVKKAGYYNISFNASTLSSGIYFYRITSGDFVQTKKMVLIK